MNRHLLLTLTFMVTTAALSLPGGDADARSRRTTQIPNDADAPCDACHIFPGGPRTSFGLQVEATMTAPGSAGDAQWSEVFNLDADGDGYTNGQEMGDTLGTWLAGDPNPGFLSDPNSVDSVPDGLTPLCTPGVETVCDGVDNNCDGNIDEGLDCTPTVDSFAADRATVQADGVELQTLRVTLNAGQTVDELRMIVNHPWHTENGREYDSYLTVGEGICREQGVGFNNDKIALDSCQINDNPDGSREFVISYSIDPIFGAATDHVVSALWFSDGTALSTWTKLTTPGNGFATTVDPGFTPPASFNAFAFDQSTIANDDVEVQTFRVRFDSADDITEILVYVNHPWHTENGSIGDGYFRVGPGLCNEVGAGSGNNTVTLITDACQITDVGGGVTEFSLNFTTNNRFLASTNNAVSILWYENNTAASTWTKVTTTGNGFDVTAAQSPPSTLNSFAFDQASVANDDVEVQTFRVRFNDAENITEAFLLINHPWHTENGREYDGYFRVGPGLCNEVGAGLGNDRVSLITDACQINDLGGGVTEFVVNFTVNDGFTASNNHTVSAYWKEGDTVIRTWTKVTTTGSGFDVTLPQADPSTLNSFSYDQASVTNDDLDVQTFRVRFNDADNITEVFLLINHPWHTENGREYDGYFRVGPGLCNEVGAGLGNDTVTLDTGACEINDLGGGVTEFVVNFTINGGFPASTNHAVSTYWKEGDTVVKTWTRATTPGSGFDVTAP